MPGRGREIIMLAGVRGNGMVGAAVKPGRSIGEGADAPRFQKIPERGGVSPK
jgi:hypothetical protein